MKMMPRFSPTNPINGTSLQSNELRFERPVGAWRDSYSAMIRKTNQGNKDDPDRDKELGRREGESDGCHSHRLLVSKWTFFSQVT